uniref:Mitochondrial glutamate carrier 2 n=1 Tax=Glossina brevipalpis TaxID=37001 RepID=A0A1A9WTC7_9MUSC
MSEKSTPNATSSKKPSIEFQDRHFISGSKYTGILADPLNCMEGYGTYQFPDGSSYIGYFSRGLFHGQGTLRLAPPYNLTFKGVFSRGDLYKVNEMWFADGLFVNARIKGFEMDFSRWNYCTNIDRRFVDEHVNGLRPVGPEKLKTARRPPRALPSTCFDVEEGFYNPHNKLLTHRPPPFKDMVFVGCRGDADWIIKSCRRGAKLPPYIAADVCQHIVRNNLNSENSLYAHATRCQYNQDMQRKYRFEQLCKTPKKLEELSDESKEFVEFAVSRSTSSCSTFSTTSLEVDLHEQLATSEQYDRYMNERVETDTTVYINIPDTQRTLELLFIFSISRFKITELKLFFWKLAKKLQKVINMSNEASRKFHILPKIINGGVAGIAGVTCVFPLDLVKTRLQNQQIGPDGEMMYKNIIDAFRKTYKAEGLFGMYRGSAVNIILITPEKAIKLTANDYFRYRLTTADGRLPFFNQMVAGGGAGAFQIIVTTPMELLKIQMQDAGRIAAQAKAEGQTVEMPSTMKIIQNLLQERGIFGLYRGLKATALRDITFSSLYFPLFAVLNALGPRRDDGSGEAVFWWSFLGGLAAGSFTAFIVTPLDVIKTRLQLIRKGVGEKEFAGIIDCAIKTWQSEGVTAFFKGGLCRVMSDLKF